jgi:hypothetical protein
MVRLGRQIPHFEEVNPNSLEAVFSKEKDYRYLLSMNFNNSLLNQSRFNTATVILKNPSAADEGKADATIRRVETFIYYKFTDVRILNVLNIFAFRATEPQDLVEAFIKGGAMNVIGEENDRFIDSTVKESDYVILAWGNNSGINKDLYEERIFRVKQILNGVPQQKLFHISGMTKTKHPLHGLMWGYNYAVNSARDYLEEK